MVLPLLSGGAGFGGPPLAVGAACGGLVAEFVVVLGGSWGLVTTNK